MNLQTSPTDPPLRLLVVNPLAPATKLAVTEILLGTTFGPEQLIDVILLVYSNETAEAEEFKMELRACAYSNCNSIRVSSDLPRLSDADVFYFGTKFPNPNRIDYSQIHTEEHFDTMYHILKVAHNLTVPSPQKVGEDKGKSKRKKEPEKKTYKPIIIANGLVTLHILKAICKDLPPDILFCPTPVPRAAKSVLGEYLKVELTNLNLSHVWAADDQVFHIEVEKPLLLYDKIRDRGVCGKEMVSPEILESLNLDHLQLSEAWIQKDLVDKIVTSLSRNPYGSIFSASEIVRALHKIWRSRRNIGEKVRINMGVISDGSLGTIKGLPYVLPLIFECDSWTVNNHFERDPFLQIAIKRINKAAKEHNAKLVPYCKKFLEDNVIKMKFVPTETEETSTISVPSESTDL